MVLVYAIVVSSLAQAGLGGARPLECGSQDGNRGHNRWERAKEPNLGRYCALLASGTSKLVSEGALLRDVPAIADEAEKLLPNRAAPAVLRGRALLRLGQPAEARKALEHARARDARAFDDPAALLAWARANGRMGQLAEATRAYRTVLPRTSVLSMADRASAAFEAGLLLMASGPKDIDGCIAMLRQAQHQSQDALRFAAHIAVALALQRSGKDAEVRGILAEHLGEDAVPLLKDAGVREALADSGVAYESDSLLAVAQTLTDPAAARESWQKYLDGPGGKGPWADHARASLRALSARAVSGGKR